MRESSHNFMGFIRRFKISDIFRRQAQIHGSDSSIKVRDFRGSDNRSGNAFRQCPGQRHFGHGHSQTLGDLSDPVDDLQVILLA